MECRRFEKKIGVRKDRGLCVDSLFGRERRRIECRFVRVVVRGDGVGEACRVAFCSCRRVDSSLVRERGVFLVEAVAF